MIDFSERRQQMVGRQIEARGVRSQKVLDAMGKVPREFFLPEDLREFAYEDSPLPIEAKQTISQPYIVAFMIEGLALKGGENVLEIGAGSGYAAAVLAEIAGEVYTIERIEELATHAASTLADLNYENIEVIHADGTLGLPEHAPFDAIVVTAGGPNVPETLKKQLKIGGRMVIPVGSYQGIQELVRVTRLSQSDYKQEDLADVRFVPLVGAEGWKPEGKSTSVAAPKTRATVPTDEELKNLIAGSCNPFDSAETAILTHCLNGLAIQR